MFPRWIAILLLVLLGGCGTAHKNLNHQPDVIASGVVGQRYQATLDLRLVKIKSLPHYRLARADATFDSTTERLIGPVPTGTVVIVVRVEDEVLRSLVWEHREVIAIGRIVGGALSDREIVLGWSPGAKEITWPPFFRRVD